MGRKVFTLEYAASPQRIRVPFIKRDVARLQGSARIRAHEEAEFTHVHVLASFGSPVPPNTMFYVESWAVEMGFFGL